MELGGEWSKLSDNKSRHKEEISIDVNGHNERLLLQLQKKGFITSYQEKNDRKKSCFDVEDKSYYTNAFMLQSISR